MKPGKFKRFSVLVCVKRKAKKLKERITFFLTSEINKYITGILIVGILQLCQPYNHDKIRVYCVK